jgi:hypothetical protein
MLFERAPKNPVAMKVPAAEATSPRVAGWIRNGVVARANCRARFLRVIATIR